MTVDSFSDLVFLMIECKEDSIAARFSVVLWSIWKERNNFLWDGSCKAAADMVHCSTVYLHEWGNASMSPRNYCSRNLNNALGHIGRSLIIPGCMEVEVGEAMGFLEALSWVKSMGLDNGNIEGDVKLVVDGINSSTTYNHVLSLVTMWKPVGILFALSRRLMLVLFEGVPMLWHMNLQEFLVYLRTPLLGLTRRTLWQDCLLRFVLAIMKSKAS
ncbi:hypothetical protein ACS0TY_007486 [Phlomoides rotata]